MCYILRHPWYWLYQQISCHLVLQKPIYLLTDLFQFYEHRPLMVIVNTLTTAVCLSLFPLLGKVLIVN